MASISLEEVTKEFGSSEAAVDRLNLTVPDGEFMCLLGPSGCGKTTTLRMIAGLEQPTAGNVKVDGRLLASPDAGEYVPPEKRKMGLVFQNYALWPHLTVRENVMFGLRMQRWPRGSRDARVHEVLEMVGVLQQIDRYPSELSGGQQQRVALARMLAVNPEVLLLDEPLSNLDAALRLAMRSELKRLHQQTSSTVVFVTHDQFEAMTLATMIAVMDQGELQQVGSPIELYRRPANRFVAGFLGSPPMNFLTGHDAGGSELAAELARYVESALEEYGAETDQPIDSIGFRPEAMRLGTPPADAAAGTWQTRAGVEAVLPTGATWIVELSRGGDRLFGLSFVEPDVREKHEGACWVSANDLHVFDADGLRLEVADDALRARAGGRAAAADGMIGEVPS